MKKEQSSNANNTSDMASHPQEQFMQVIELIRRTRANVVYMANAALIELYWQIGRMLTTKIANAEWGDGVVMRLADYIAKTEPGLKGFSAQNLWRMKQFYETYKGTEEKLSTLLREISWSNNLTIMSRAKTNEEREFYIRKNIVERWSHRELNRQIDSALFERAMMSSPKLSPVLRDLAPLAMQVFRDQYVLEFVGGRTYEHENDLRTSLVRQMKQFILELGRDFIFIDQEFRLQVGNTDFRIDLLFFHRELQCLVAFELKMGAFRPEHLGQLNFYLEALDRDVKKPKENPSIGVLLCKDKDNEVVEYALSRSLSPTMVAEYQLCLPDKRIIQQKMKQLYEEQTNFLND